MRKVSKENLRPISYGSSANIVKDLIIRFRAKDLSLPLLIIWISSSICLHFRHEAWRDEWQNINFISHATLNGIAEESRLETVSPLWYLFLKVLSFGMSPNLIFFAILIICLGFTSVFILNRQIPLLWRFSALSFTFVFYDWTQFARPYAIIFSLSLFFTSQTLKAKRLTTTELLVLLALLQLGFWGIFVSIGLLGCVLINGVRLNTKRTMLFVLLLSVSIWPFLTNYGRASWAGSSTSLDFSSPFSKLQATLHSLSTAILPKSGSGIDSIVDFAPLLQHPKVQFIFVLIIFLVGVLHAARISHLLLILVLCQLIGFVSWTSFVYPGGLRHWGFGVFVPYLTFTYLNALPEKDQSRSYRINLTVAKTIAIPVLIINLIATSNLYLADFNYPFSTITDAKSKTLTTLTVVYPSFLSIPFVGIDNPKIYLPEGSQEGYFRFTGNSGIIPKVPPTFLCKKRLNILTNWETGKNLIASNQFKLKFRTRPALKAEEGDVYLVTSPDLCRPGNWDLLVNALTPSTGRRAS